MGETHVKGLKELQAMLNTLPAKIEANILRGALRAGMKPVQEAAKANAAHASGLLRDGLKISTRLKNGRATARLRTTGKHAWLANWIEFGTAAHTIKPKKGKALFFFGTSVAAVEHPGSRAKPFMRPALDSQTDAAVIATGEYIRKRLSTKHGLDTADINIEEEA